jgi:hypothetical protein
MDVNAKLYKTFFILKLENKSNLLQAHKDSGTYEDADKKIVITNNFIQENTLELKMLWETIKEIKSQEIDDEGEVVSTVQKLKEVNQACIWTYDSDYPYIFVFTPRTSLLKDIQDILSTYFKVSTKVMTFSNDFFKNLLNSDFVYEVQSLSYQTNKENYSTITVSGANMKDSYFFDNIYNPDSSINEMTVILLNYNKVKFYKNSKTTIYDKAYMSDIVETINDLWFFLKRGGLLLE